MYSFTMRFSLMLHWLSTDWPPVVTLLIGSAVLVFVGYINWHHGTKANGIRWIAQHIYRNTLRSEVLADNMFMTATAYLLAIGA